MIKFTGLLYVGLALMFAPGRAQATSLDVSALSSTTTRQVMVSGEHVQKYEHTSSEVSGKYLRTQGREAIWEMGISTQTGVWAGFILDQDTRVYNTHATLAGGIGRRLPGFWMAAGSRVEYDNDNNRTIFGRLAASIETKWTPKLRGKTLIFAVSSSGELLKTDGKEVRFDYKVAAKYQISRYFYLGIRFDDVRSTKTQGLSLGLNW